MLAKVCSAAVNGIEAYPVEVEVNAGFPEGEIKIAPVKVDIRKLFDHPPDEEMDFAHVKGQESVKRALEIAAAGGHNVFMLSSFPPFTRSALINA